MKRKGKRKKNTMFGTHKFPSYDQILDTYGKEFSRYIHPKGKTTFGFWMQTIADFKLLDLELQGLTKKYKIYPIKRTAKVKGNLEFIKMRVAHLEKVEGEKTLYTRFADLYNDTNAYAFHNIYPYKGKFYPRVVRTLINTFKLKPGALILDPFNGSGTTTHEASLMGIESYGIDVTPMGIMLSELKNELLFMPSEKLDYENDDLIKIINLIKKKRWKHPNETLRKLMLAIYFDTEDAFTRTSRYNKKGKTGLFVEKFKYIQECYNKLISLKKEYSLKFKRAKIISGDVLELKKIRRLKEKFDAIITSPPYYFSIDYVGKDKIAYEYLGVNMKEVESKYLGMKNNNLIEKNYGDLPKKVVHYYEDLRQSIENMYWALKKGGKMAIIVGDSTVKGRKIPTTIMTRKFCEDVGFKFENLIFNPLLGARNRAIRGESIIIFEK